MGIRVPSRLFLLVIVLSGCSSPNRVGVQNSPDVVAAFVETVDAKYQSQQSTLGLRDVTLKFSLIPGSIFGAPSTGDVLIERTQVGNTFNLDLRRLGDSAARLASPLNPRMAEAGMVIEPRNTRLARVGTFVFDTQTDQSSAAGMFIEPGTRDALALVYFDEPCRIAGLMRMGEIEARHDIVIPGRGLHWIGIRESAGNHFYLWTSKVSERVIFGIRPFRKTPAGQDA